MEMTRVERAKWEWPALKTPPAPATLKFEETLALFAVGLAKEEAPALLRNLAADRRDRAIAIGTELLANRSEVPPRMVRAFGPRPDSDARLRELYEEAPRALREAIYRRLPPYQRSLFAGHAAGGDRDEVPLIGAMAERLIREATR